MPSARSAFAASVPHQTHVSAPYEAPEHPELELEACVLSVEAPLERVVERIRPLLGSRA